MDIEPPTGASAQHHRHTLHALGQARGNLQRWALKLFGYVVLAYLLLRLIPSLKQALHSLEQVEWQWLLAALVLETLSEIGFVVSWRAIVDRDNVLEGGGRGRRLSSRVAWAQLGGGLLVPGGSYAGVGVGAWILHRLGMPLKLIAERQFSLSFLNTAVDALALIVCGVGLAVGIFAGKRDLTLTLLPAVVAAAALGAAIVVARRATHYGERRRVNHPRVATAVVTLADAVEDTDQLLFHRRDWRSILGAVAYLGFDVLVLWIAFSAINVHPVPSFAAVLMAYIIGALGGSLPLPAGIGAVGGIAGFLILYGIGRDAAVAAAVLYGAISLIVPLVVGAAAYVLLRRQFGAIPVAAEESASAPA